MMKVSGNGPQRFDLMQGDSTMAIHTLALNVINSDPNNRRYELGGELSVAFAGQVLSVQNWTGPEPHWDSGRMADTGEVATVFNGRTWRVICPDGLRSDFHREVGYRIEVDASPEVRLEAEIWSAWETWFRLVDHATRLEAEAKRDHARPTRGKRVVVVKGRKVKKGTTWHVHATGTGDYGPYVHLSSEPLGMGEYVKYVNPDNLAVVDDFVSPATFPPSPAGRDEMLLTLARAWNAIDRASYSNPKIDRDETLALLAIADRLEELGHDVALGHAARVRRAASAQRI
jgi:hypothetical protein